jgi:RNA polymerase sigma-70 factor (ECF subfamily)
MDIAMNIQGYQSQPPVEERTVVLAQQGDEQAFRDLYEKNYGRIFRLAFRYMRTAEDAEDVAQETFIKAYGGLRSFDANLSAGFPAWLNRICVNCAIDHRRKAKRTGGQGVVALDDLHYEPASPGPSPEETAISARAMSDLEDMVDNLSPRQQVIFTLRYRRHMDIKQIAGHLDCSEGNVRLHLFRSTLKLRHFFSLAALAS